MDLTTEILKEPYVFLSELKKAAALKEPKISKPKKLKANSHRNLMFAANNKCHYCTCEMVLADKVTQDNHATIEHKIPKSRGGTNDIANKVLSCLACNRDKGRLTDEEYLAVLAVREKYKTQQT